ncbi:MAG: hypothetical protein LZ174_09020 [Thaumarchaeota archaeon]|jgi:hypothetical protein|nr:hypothetical protein [Candidatus Geocrenenecus arthurdayi]
MDNNDKAVDKVFHSCGNPNCDWSPKKNVHGVEIEFDGKGFIFRCGPMNAGPYLDIYKLEPRELSEKLGLDNETSSFVRFEALSIYQDRELSIDDLIDVLGLTIKHDNVNKVVAFLVMLSAFTNSDQLNISFRAESSTGKSYVPLEVSTLFPQDRVIKIAYSSPTAFFHEKGKIDEETKEIIIDLEKKIVIFLDQPHDQLLERLRPLLSHDQKVLYYKITDKREKSGLRTKNVKIIGFPAVVFCTGRLRVDEQEATRMILLSPEVSQEKLREAIYLRIMREADEEKFREYVESNPKRKALRERVRKISELNIKEIRIPEHGEAYEKFTSRRKILKPRHMRDVSRVMALAKTLALLNYMHRKIEEKNDGLVVYASEKDLEDAFKLWDEISEPQELNLSPFALQVYREVIEALAVEKVRRNDIAGATKIEICEKFLKVFGRPLSMTTLDREIIPALISAGLITIESHPNDRRVKLVKPVYIDRLYGEYTPPSSDEYLSKDISFSGSNIQRNSSLNSGVTRVEHGYIKNLQENYEFQRNTSSNSGVYHSSEPTTPSSFLTPSNEHRGDAVCSMCMHWDALKCLKHPDWIVVTPTARYAKTCIFFNPRSGSGEVGHV